MPRRASGSIVRRGKRFLVRLTLPGGKRTTRGSWTTRKDAEKAIPGLMVEARAAETALPEAYLWDFVQDEYRAVLATRLAESTMKIIVPMMRDCAAWLARRRPDVTMRQVERGDAEAYVAHLGETIAGSTVARHVQALKQAWDGAMVRGYASVNPWAGLRLKREQERAVPWVEPDDLRRLILATAPRHRALVQILAETGLRRGEAYALEWRDVDFPRRKLLVRRSKSRRIREVDISDTALETLTDLSAQRKGDRVFAGLPCYDILRTDLREAAARVGLPPLRVHDLRHVYASHLVRAGVAVPAVAALLGHSDGGRLVLMRYGRWQPETAGAQAMAKLAAFRAPRPTAKRRSRRA